MTQPSCPASISVRGIRLVNLAMDDALAAIEAALAMRQPTRVAFVNADCVNIAAINRVYQKTLADTDWIFIDGIGMRIAGKLIDQPVRDNVNGTDMFPLLCEMLAGQRKKLFLYGARPDVAAAAADWAQARYPLLQIAGVRHGYLGPAEKARTAEVIRDSGADVVLVALGAPHQETWIADNFAATGATVAIGVGGLFDFYSGRISRAPLWMRRAGLEWVFRLIQEPGRMWRRYLVGNAVFLWRVVGDQLAARFRSASPARHTSAQFGE